MVSAPRLLLLVNESQYFLSHRVNIAREAVRQGFDVHLVTRLTHHRREIERYGVRVHHVDFPRNLRHPGVELRAVRELRRIYRAVEPDVLHHFSAKAVLLGSMAARTLRLPHVINTFTGLGSAFCGTGVSGLLRRLTASVCIRHLLSPRSWRVTFQNQEDMQQLIGMGLVREDQCALIRGSGVDPAAFHPRRESTGLATVMLPSRMIWSKGVGEFVKAARLLKQTAAAARFVLVGQSDEQNPHAVPPAQLRAWNDEGVVQWWGHCEDMAETIGRASLIVLPTCYGEGLPKVLLEAAACAKPIVTTDLRGCRDVVRHGMNGLLVPKGDVEALASAIWQLLDQPALRHRMGQLGRALVLREFTAAQVAASTVAMYQQMLGLPVAKQTVVDRSLQRAA